MSMQSVLSESERNQSAQRFRALADPARIAIIGALSRTDREICVCEFTEALGLNQSTVSHHLKILKDANLVRSERRGTWGYYSLDPAARQHLEAALASVLPVEELV